MDKKDRRSLSAIILAVLAVAAVIADAAVNLWSDNPEVDSKRVDQLEAQVGALIEQNRELIDSLPDWFSESEGSSDDPVNSQ